MRAARPASVSVVTGMKKRTKVDVLTRVLNAYPSLRHEENSPIHQFLATAATIDIPQGLVVFKKGEPCSDFLLLLRGTLRLQVASESGREVTLYRLVAGSSCAVTTASLISGDAYSAEAITEADVTAVAIPRAEFLAALTASERFRQFIFDGFAERFATVIARIDAFVLKSVDERLIDELLGMDERTLSELSHRRIAADIGTAREVVSRRLKALEASGLIRVNRGNIRVKDREGLRALQKASE